MIILAKKPHMPGCNIGITAGTYYLKVSSYNYSDKNYNFKINYTSSSIWETESMMIIKVQIV